MNPTGSVGRVRPWLWACFAWRGRIGRLGFLLGIASTLVMSAVARGVASVGQGAGAFLGVPIMGLVIYLLVSLPVRRARDLGVPPSRILPAYGLACYVCWSVDVHNVLPHHPVLNLFQIAFLLALATLPGRSLRTPSSANDP